MKKNIQHHKKHLQCLWVSMLGKLDAQFTKWGLKTQREHMSCQEFTILMQDILDQALNEEELLLFEKQQEKCKLCAEKFVTEQETLLLIKSKLQENRQPLPKGFEMEVRNQVLIY